MTTGHTETGPTEHVPPLATAPPADAEPAPPGPAERGRRPANRFVDLLRSDIVSGSATIVAFIILLGPVYGAWLGGDFFRTEARVFDLYQNVPSMLLSVGILIPLSCGQFDLAVAPLASLSVFMTIGLPMKQDVPLWAAILVTLALGAVVGAVNGFLVVRIRINAFIATLATSGVVAGAYTVYSGGSTITPSTTEGKYAHSFRSLTSFGGFQHKAPLALVWVLIALLIASSFLAVRDRWTGEGSRPMLALGGLAVVYAAVIVGLVITDVPQQVNWSIVVLLTVAWILWIVFRFTEHGRNLFAIGGNPVAARLAGVNVNRYMFIAFIASGLIAALSGVMLAASQGTAVPGIADSFLLPAYAAAFLSTVILSAGRFHVWGTVVGGLFVVWVAQGLVIGGVSYTWTDVVNGLVLLGAVAFSTALRRESR